MPISTEELTGGITRVILEGRLDIEGAAAVDLQMNVIAGSRKAVLVDMEKVSFLGSMGLRALIAPASSYQRPRWQDGSVQAQRVSRKSSEDKWRGHTNPRASRTPDSHRGTAINRGARKKDCSSSPFDFAQT